MIVKFIDSEVNSPSRVVSILKFAISWNETNFDYILLFLFSLLVNQNQIIRATAF